MESLDVVDENNELLGIVKDRKTVHEKALWHRLVSCWIMNEKGEILLQKRSSMKKRNPNKWSRTGGHVNAGESVENAIIREVKEEIGIELSKQELKLLCTYKRDNIQDKYFGYDFFANVSPKISECVLQKEEVSAVKYMTIEEMELAKEQNNKDYSFVDWTDEEFYKTIKILKDERKSIFLQNSQGM